MIYKDQSHKAYTRLPVSLTSVELKLIEDTASHLGVNRCAFVKLAVRKYINELKAA
jgi:hypothetical protein